MNQKKLVIYYILISSIFIFLLFILNLYSSRESINTEINRYYLTVIFVLICFFGFSLSFYPRWYHNIILNKKKSTIITEIDNKNRIKEGHHPSCIKFKNHVIKIKNKKYCAGCFGLGTGSLISIFLITYYLLFNNDEYSILYQYYFFLGLLFVILSFFEIFINKNSILHILSNILLIIGFLIITISTLENTNNLIYGLIAILGSFLFLETRIQISIFKHINICDKCIEKCKMY